MNRVTTRIFFEGINQITFALSEKDVSSQNNGINTRY
jgi:hypothetical protein